MPADRGTGRIFGWAALAGFVGCVWLSNYLLTTYGFWHLPGTPYDVPAGVYVVGLSFGLRDAVQERLGPWWVLPGIAAGAALSMLLSEAVVTPDGFVVATAMRVAIASGVAFTLSELADFAIYTPLRRQSWPLAVALSNVVAAIADSALFLWLCFGSLDFIQGQVIGKVAMTAFAFPIVWWARRRRRDDGRGSGGSSAEERRVEHGDSRYPSVEKPRKSRVRFPSAAATSRGPAGRQ